MQKSEKSGYVQKINALKIGNASLILGGGREEIEDDQEWEKVSKILDEMFKDITE